MTNRTRSLHAIFFALVFSAALFSCAPTNLAHQNLAPAAPQPSPIDLANDYLHFIGVNSVELANATGEKLLAAKLESQEFFAAIEAGAGGRSARAIMQSATRRKDFQAVAVKVLQKYDDGFRTYMQDRDSILIEITRLSKGVRGYTIAKERLALGGPKAIEVMNEVAQDPAQKEIRPLVLKAIEEIKNNSPK